MATGTTSERGPGPHRRVASSVRSAGLDAISLAASVSASAARPPRLAPDELDHGLRTYPNARGARPRRRRTWISPVERERGAASRRVAAEFDPSVDAHATGSSRRRRAPLDHAPRAGEAGESAASGIVVERPRPASCWPCQVVREPAPRRQHTGVRGTITLLHSQLAGESRSACCRPAAEDDERVGRAIGGRRAIVTRRIVLRPWSSLPIAGRTPRRRAPPGPRSSSAAARRSRRAPALAFLVER